MREYETTFIVQPEITEDGCQELFGRVDGVLEKAGATRLLHDDQGKRRLAYEIRNFQKGRYVTTYFLSEGTAVAPLELALRLDESVLRFLTVLKTEAVADVEARIAEAKEDERIRSERAKERAQREAEEEKARQEAALRAADEAAAASQAREEEAAASAARADAEAGETPADGGGAAEAAAEPATAEDAAQEDAQ